MAAFLPDDLEIAPNYTVGGWKALKLENLNDPTSNDWKTAFKIFETRIRCRYLDPVDKLIDFEKNCLRKTFGFTILSIDCLVIETLQGFREGKTNHRGISERLFTKFLTDWDVFNECVPSEVETAACAKKIYQGYRCELHHSGATHDAFRVLARGRLFDFKSDREVSVNRTLLHKHLKNEFDTYLTELRGQQAADLRRMFRQKMDFICGHARAHPNV